MLVLLVPGVGMGGGDAAVVVAGLPGRRRYVLPNGIRVEATEEELDRYLLPFTRPVREEIIAASVIVKSKSIKPSTVARQAAITPEIQSQDIQQDIALLLLL